NGTREILRLDKCEIGFAIFCRLALYLRFFSGWQFGLEFARDFLGQIRLNREHISEVAIVIFRPYVLIILGVNQLHVHAYSIANTTNTALEKGCDAQRL